MSFRDPTEPPPAPLDPAIKALFDKLPRPGSDWPAAKRVHWLRCLEGIFQLVYRAEDGSVAINHPSTAREPRA